MACLGSSSTAGKGQAFNWIAELERRPGNRRFRFRNFGVGGDLAYNALQRVGEVIAVHPAKVVVLIGANDVLALVSSGARRFYRIAKHLPADPSPEWFRENLRKIARQLKSETSADIALCSLAPIGEDLSDSDPFQGQLNRGIEEFSAIIREIGEEVGAAYVPFYEVMVRDISEAPVHAFKGQFLAIYRDAFRSLILRKTPDEIGAMNGWQYHSDGVHLNSRGGMIVADLVQQFIETVRDVDHLGAPDGAPPH